MSAAPTLTAELCTEVLALEVDLRARVNTLSEVQRSWRAEYDAAREAERTAAAWEAWVDERVTLAAVAWVLTTVFVRFCEDNELVRPVWIGGARAAEAVEAQEHFLRETARTNPDVTDREWLLEAVRHLDRLPATAGLVDPTSPMWLVSPSGDGATRLLAYWRAVDETGSLLRDLTDPELDTRFLGDLYQDISEDAKKRYALLQTPVFVEEFILDRTLEPALNERPLEGFKMIDPTCGSGHFLLGGFRRLLDRWHRQAPALDERERVQRALNAVFGVDINPFAVAVARFRLTVAALQACSMPSLEQAPAFNYHLAAGDSLLGQYGTQELDLGFSRSAPSTGSAFAYSTEDAHALARILQDGQYDCVVGNPPYITVKNPALNALYRRLYPYCKGTYALTVPFMVRFFALAKSGQAPGWAGQITSNSFMKREFGGPLIEAFLPTKDLRLLADTSGAYIPGHGTPTLILVGRNSGTSSSTVRAVLGTRGEPGRPADPAHGAVWSSIVQHVDDAGYRDEWITVADAPRTTFAKHPWSLSGGGARELTEQIEAGGSGRLAARIAGKIGFASFPGADDAFFATPGALRRDRVPAAFAKPVITGDIVRDYRVGTGDWALAPYNENADLVPLDLTSWGRRLWSLRTILNNVTGFGGETKADAGAPWWGWYRWVKERYRTPLSIVFAFVATHNHFVLDRGGKVFNRSAPVIKLPNGATEDEHLALLGVLNSSTACFWLKQHSHNKGSTVDAAGARTTLAPWEDFYEFTGTTIQDLPLPAVLPTGGRALDALARLLQSHAPALTTADALSRDALTAAHSQYELTLRRMIAAQEELDWETYRLYDLLGEDLTSLEVEAPELALGERAFEIVLARRVAAGEASTAWFERHGSTPITELPAHWSDDYRRLVDQRIALIESHPFIRLLEQPEYKRRWATEPWAKQEERALREWLLDRLEERQFWFDRQGRPTPRSVSALADEVARDADLTSVLALWEGRPDIAVPASLERLLASEAVPFLSAYRYKDTGLRKRADWEQTWNLQRREDAGTYESRPVRLGGDGPIPVPPKYTSADFRRPAYWANRGKRDVPKERFILYPGAGRDGDASSVLGWAGWDHAEQSLAIASVIGLGEEQGWGADRLLPLVAGLAELLPWVEQWHANPEPLYGGSSPAAFFGELLDSHMTRTGTTREALAAWRPPAAARGRKASR